MAKQKITFPEKGISKEEIIKILKNEDENDVNWKDGKVWSLVYHASDEHDNLLKEAYSMFFSKNALSPLAFPSLRKFETEVVAMTIDLLNGDRKCCGNLTSGGTESIISAIRTHRDWARDKFPHIKEPEMVLPTSAHPAFEKGAEYFDVKSVRVPVDQTTHRADMEKMKDATNENTILLVGSACDYPRGIVDPITELAALAKERGIGMHVDACLGGFLLPFVKKLGYPVPPFDFSVPGVTSISIDVHKYGYGAKGASVIAYRNDKIWKYQFTVWPDWEGGAYLTPTLRGTRPGGAMAAAWASINSLGEDGYLKLAKIVMDTAKKLIDGIKSIPQLRILGEPVMSVFSFTSEEVDIYKLSDIMEVKGWHLDRLQYPAAIHLMVNPHHAKIADALLEDLRASVNKLLENPEKSAEGTSAMYGMIATLPDRGKVKDYIINFLKDQYRIR